ncbi:MAG TPA: SDR family oxidoreductase [Candidatus Kapabacteria bacterium]|nr:SDR family oxidoreductase [Candidatus Kapabacteria bacterium]
MKKTVLITGCSSGIGRETALRFQREGWNVIATMRTPSSEQELVCLPNVICPALDVTQETTIKQAIAEGHRTFGKIDVVINNAGYGLIGPFETFSTDQINRQFQTNVLGLMSVTREILPYFRKQRSGLVINVASFAGRSIFPLYSVYHASKWAVEGFCDSLQYEVSSYGIQVKIIEPGLVKTEFWGRSTDRENRTGINAYEEDARPVLDLIDVAAGLLATKPRDVAETIWKSANDDSNRLRYIVGIDAHTTLLARKVLSDRLYRGVMKAVFSRSSVSMLQKISGKLQKVAT